MTDSPDDVFLASAGLELLPEQDRAPFLHHVHEELHRRVGIALSEGLAPGLLEEFEQLINLHELSVRAFLEKHDADWFATNGDRPIGDLAKRAQAVWLRTHRPDHRDVVRAEQERIRDEIRARAPEILAASGVDLGDATES